VPLVGLAVAFVGALAAGVVVAPAVPLFGRLIGNESLAAAAAAAAVLAAALAAPLAVPSVSVFSAVAVVGEAERSVLEGDFAGSEMGKAGDETVAAEEAGDGDRRTTASSESALATGGVAVFVLLGRPGDIGRLPLGVLLLDGMSSSCSTAAGSSFESAEKLERPSSLGE